MNFFETIQAIVNTISIPVSIVTIIFLIRQSRQTDASQRSQVYEKLIDNSLKIDQLMIENPEFRKYIYRGEPITDDLPDKDKLLGFLEFIVDVLDNAKAQEKYIPKSSRQGWTTFRNMMLSQPAMKYFIEQAGMTAWTMGAPFEEPTNGKRRSEENTAAE
jgi:hypothetical protein